jgi:hypothetical protein
MRRAKCRHTSHQRPHGLVRVVPETSHPGLCPSYPRNISCSRPSSCRLPGGSPHILWHRLNGTSCAATRRHMQGVLRTHIVSQGMLPWRDYSPCPHDGNNKKHNGRNVRTDWEQLFQFGLFRFFPCHFELRGHFTVDTTPFSGGRVIASCSLIYCQRQFSNRDLETVERK